MLKLSVSRNYFGRLFFFATFLFFSPLVFFAAFSFFCSPRFFFFALIFSIRPFSVRGFFCFFCFFFVFFFWPYFFFFPSLYVVFLHVGKDSFLMVFFAGRNTSTRAATTIFLPIRCLLQLIAKMIPHYPSLFPMILFFTFNSAFIY